MALAQGAQLCAHHPERAGFALCMSCRLVVCQECATTRDGINYCRPCLAKTHAVAGTAGPWRRIMAGLAMVAASLALFLLCARLMVWAVVLVGGWR